MSNAPAWLRCENCLWWVSGMDFGEPGCNYDIEVIPKSGFSRCNKWACKRCLKTWDEYDGYSTHHLYCKITGRKKPVKEEK